MRSLIAILTTVSLCACTAVTPVKPGDTYGQIGATVYSPNEDGWLLIQAIPEGVTFGRKHEDNDETSIANTSVFGVYGVYDDIEFLEYIAEQRRANTDNTRFKVLDVDNEIVTFKETSCLKYRTLSEDHKNEGIDSDRFQYLKIFGYICRHPLNSAIAIQMEVSNRSKDKELEEGLLLVGREFFNNIQFTSVGLTQH